MVTTEPVVVDAETDSGLADTELEPGSTELRKLTVTDSVMDTPLTVAVTVNTPTAAWVTVAVKVPKPAKTALPVVLPTTAALGEDTASVTVLVPAETRTPFSSLTVTVIVDPFDAS